MKQNNLRYLVLGILGITGVYMTTKSLVKSLNKNKAVLEKTEQAIGKINNDEIIRDIGEYLHSREEVKEMVTSKEQDHNEENKQKRKGLRFPNPSKPNYAKIPINLNNIN